jgi:predicted dehydrogenase
MNTPNGRNGAGEATDANGSNRASGSTPSDGASEDDDRLRVGVIGVGSMGQNHVRVYRSLPDVDLVGVCDADQARAAEIAAEYGTTAYTQDELLEAVDAVSVAVPTRFHEPVVRECIDAGVHVLVEKPFVDDLDAGRELKRAAEDAGVTLQVGHIERFNPAVTALSDIVKDLDVIAVEAHRVGPPLDRDLGDSVVMDLMIHDVDVILSLVDDEVRTVSGIGTRDTQYATATLQFENDVVANLTASRLTQKKVRTLTVTARDCRIDVDYMDQTIRIHRRSFPDVLRKDGKTRYRNESLVERPLVERKEPLRSELASFVEAAKTGAEPEVTAEQALRAIEVTRKIDTQAADAERDELEVPQR